jgi:hypothetical protein
MSHALNLTGYAACEVFHTRQKPGRTIVAYWQGRLGQPR